MYIFLYNFLYKSYFRKILFIYIYYYSFHNLPECSPWSSTGLSVRLPVKPSAIVYYCIRGILGYPICVTGR